MNSSSHCIPVLTVTSPRGFRFKRWLSSQGPLGPRQFAWLPLAALIGMLLYSQRHAASAEWTQTVPVTFPTPVSFQEDATDAREALTPENPDDLLGAAIEHATPAFVFVGGGSGVCVSSDGYILTNFHVIDRKKRWTVRVNGVSQAYEADVVGTDPLGDVALLKISSVNNLPFAKLSTLENVRAGQQVIAVGDPYKLGDLDGPPSVSLGTLSARHRYPGLPTQGARTFYADALQTDAAVNPGNSGGPLMDLKGEVLGLTGQIMARFGGKANSRIAYAVPAPQLTRFLPLLKEAQGGVVHHGAMPTGLELDMNTVESAATAALNGWPKTWPVGTRVASVQDNSQAVRDGFKSGDRLIAIDGEPILGAYRALSVVQSQPEGVELHFEVARRSSTANGWERVVLKSRLPRLELPK